MLGPVFAAMDQMVAQSDRYMLSVRANTPQQGGRVTTPALTAHIAAVLLDMDGTLVDSDAAVDRSWAHWAGMRGVHLAEVARVIPGRPVTESVALLAPWLDPAEQRADARELLAWELADLDDIRPTCGAVELLAALRSWDMPHAIVTSAGETLARARLSVAGIPVPDVLITSTIVRRGKPDPEGYLLAAERLGVAASACMVVEDTPAGVQAGLAAGAVVVAVREVPSAHLCVSDLHELRRLIERQLDSAQST